MCCGSNRQIHRLQKSCGEKGLHSCSLSEREPRPQPGQAFIVFLGTLHQDGPHLLCTGLLRVVTENKREDVANYIKEEGYLKM